MRTNTNWTRRLAALGIVAGGLIVTAEFARTQNPISPAPADADYATRPVALIYGNVPVTRQELGEFLMARGGVEKVELLVNKKIIEVEAKRLNVAVSDKEMEAALMDDLDGLSIKKVDFVKAVLPRYGKTLYEWMEDVIRPKLLLSKMCRDQVKVEVADLRIQFEREYGEKRAVQMIGWPPNEDKKRMQEMWDRIRKSQDEFDREARAQANPSLAAACGHVKPISRHLPAQESIVEKRAFQLQVGEVSEILQTSQGWMVMKLHKIIPPDDKVKFEDVRPRLEKQAFDEKMSAEIPKFFATLKAKAAPNVMYTGPAIWRFDSSPAPAQNPLQGVVPASATQPVPSTPPGSK